jgi:hypothetical protein
MWLHFVGSVKKVPRISLGDMFKSSLVLIAGIASFLQIPSACQAEEDPYAVLTSFVSVTDRTTAPECSLAMLADFEQYPSHLALFREAWLNREFSLDFYRQRQKQIFLFVILKRYAELVTEGLYAGVANPTLNECSFKIDIKSFDKFGQTRIQPAVSWRFNRRQADKVDWRNIDPKDFSEIAIDYQFAAAIDDWYSGEPSMGNAKSSKSDARTSGCDEQFLRANAIFIRATTYCAKNYMDSRAGYYALEMSRRCTGLGEAGVSSKTKEAMEELDRVVKQKGKPFACQWVDGLERSVLQSISK